MEWNASELERKHALSILWYVKNNPGMTKTDIVRMDRGGEKTKYAILSELVDLGLIESRISSGRSWNSECLYLTEPGKRIADHIEAINQIMAEIDSADSQSNSSENKEE